MLELNKIHCMDCLEGMKLLDDNSINCCVTSPPYWALRDYGVDGQLGLEATPEEYISKLCDIFDEVKRVLRKDGTCWVNIGDTYYTKSGGKFENDLVVKRTAEEVSQTTGINRANELRGKPHDYLKSKSLCLIPQQFQIEMVKRGWICRNTIIWHKQNCMPTSVKDRFTVDFEYLFFFVKSKKYFFKQQFENYQSNIQPPRDKSNEKYKGTNLYSPGSRNYYSKGARNKRTVWKISTKPYKEAHFATYPPELIESPIDAGCPKEGVVLDPFIGSGTTAQVALIQGKRFIGYELNPDYIEIANKRIKPYLNQTRLI